MRKKEKQGKWRKKKRIMKERSIQH
jgi:hypothetical protein